MGLYLVGNGSHEMESEREMRFVQAIKVTSPSQTATGLTLKP